MFWLIGLAWLGGVAAAPFLMLEWRVGVWISCVSLAAALAVRHSRQRQLCVGLAFFLIGLMYTGWYYPRLEPISATSARLSGTAATLNQGNVTSFVTLRLSTIDDRSARGTIEVRLPSGAEVNGGDALEVRGEVKPVARTLKDPALRGQMLNATLISRRGGAQSVWDRWRRQLVLRMSQLLPAPENGFLAGLLVGERAALGKDLRTQLNTTGTSHIIAVSGYNLSVIVVALMLLRGRMPYRVLIGGSLGFVISFTMLTGASASVVRAAIMAGVVLFGRLFFLWGGVERLLLIAAVAMTAWNPQVLLGDLGFELSFLATAGLIWIEPRLRPLLGWLPGGLGEVASVTLSAQLATLPLLLLVFGRLSIVALPLNVVILPLIPLGMLLGFVALLASLVAWPLGLLFGLLTWTVLHMVLLGIGAGAGVANGSVILNGTMRYVAVGLSVLIVILLLIRRSRLQSYELV